MIPNDDPGLMMVARHLAGQGGPPLGDYKDRCLRRRLAVRMRACGVTTLIEYAALLDGSVEETRRLLEALTINVTQFFRNPEVWERLDEVLRPMVRSRHGMLHAWSAGCASGQESYSLALLLHQLGREEWGELARPASIDATDLDDHSLALARAGRYPATAVPAVHRCAALFERAGGEVVVPAAIRDWLRIFRHDLLREPPPSPPYDVILCRNVIIYFERDAQDRLLTACADALSAGGLLVLGRVESVLGPARAALELVHPRERIYRRIA